jgi:endonuclease/exonuclease/phosphatase family metal-dependent hydrolase
MGRVEVVAATFNIHAGIDGYGRPFDVVGACGELGADIIFLEEVFHPGKGPSQAALVADELGFHCSEVPLTRALRLRHPLTGAPVGEWEPRRPYSRGARSLLVGGSLRRKGRRASQYEEGAWGIAVLTREAPVGFSVIELGRLRRDVTRRAALVVELPSGLKAIGTHMSHFTHGSPLHVLRLRAGLPGADRPAILGGDMNFWGPPVELCLPGWRRAAKAKTWPARRPLHQLDHLLVTRPVERLGGEAVRLGNSDHLPLRARIAFPA